MDLLDNIRQLMRAGLFGEALRALEGTHIPHGRESTMQVLKSELLERVGRHVPSRVIATNLLRLGKLTPAERSCAEYTLGRLYLEDGAAQRAVEHLRRAASLAHESDNLERLCRAQLLLLLAVTDASAPEIAETRIAEIRANVVRHGDPQLAAALHLYVGELEARRGFLKNAERHIALAKALLIDSPNVWLEAMAENNSSGICLLRSDFALAEAHGLRGRELSERSGAASACCASLANLGSVFQARGDFDRAAECYERALAAFPTMSNRNSGTLDGLARVRLSQRRLDECADLLDQIDSSIQTPQDRKLYGYRYAAYTRIQLEERTSSLSEAMLQTDAALALADTAGDQLLRKMLLLAKADVALKARRTEDCLSILRSIEPHLSLESPELCGQYERILACSCLASNRLVAGKKHFERAKRIFKSVRSAQGLMELERRWEETLTEHPELHLDYVPTSTEADAGTTSSTLHDIATLLLHIGQPDRLAQELVELIGRTAAALWAVVVKRANDSSAVVIASIGDYHPDWPSSSDERRVTLSSGPKMIIELIVQPKDDAESLATINAVASLVVLITDLDQARTEREERATLWPEDEVPASDGSVRTGHMREQISRAKRIAKTNVSVLITGESGTGKEVLARAIHMYSDRAQHPFVPFNCAAVPRELLESQLFGHRRGAFTGADRNAPGVVLSAKGGTLFLDEIGELSLDLQPKLLRFLESGEICPIGESTPFTVDVRIVSATNAKLERLVRDGLFREDLFYRLDVIRFALDPLRERRDEIPDLVKHFAHRAANELRKGDIRIATETMERLVLYGWPGNVRQLQNEVRRMVAFADPNGTLTLADISPEVLKFSNLSDAPKSGSTELSVSLSDKLLPTISRFEREMIKKALHDHQGKVEAAAKALGISRKGLYLKRQRLGLY